LFGTSVMTDSKCILLLRYPWDRSQCEWGCPIGQHWTLKWLYLEFVLIKLPDVGVSILDICLDMNSLLSQRCFNLIHLCIDSFPLLLTGLDAHSTGNNDDLHIGYEAVWRREVAVCGNRSGGVFGGGGRVCEAEEDRGWVVENSMIGIW